MTVKTPLAFVRWKSCRRFVDPLVGGTVRDERRSGIRGGNRVGAEGDEGPQPVTCIHPSVQIS